MKYDVEVIAKHLWIALMAVVIIVIVLVVFSPGETKSTCSGFQYFVFLSQKLTPDSYSLELLNGPRDVTVTGFEIDGQKLDAGSVGAQAGDGFVIQSAGIGGKTGDNFGHRVTIMYDTPAIKENSDYATCTGRVQ